MGGTTSSDVNTADRQFVEKTEGGLHMIEFHMPTMGASLMTIIIVLALLLCIYFAFKKVTQRRFLPINNQQLRPSMVPTQSSQALQPRQGSSGNYQPRFVLEMDPRVIRALTHRPAEVPATTQIQTRTRYVERPTRHRADVSVYGDQDQSDDDQNDDGIEVSQV